MTAAYHQSGESVLETLQAIDWFQSVGEPHPDVASRATSWKEALKNNASRQWDSVLNQAGGDLTEWLHTHARDRYYAWNQHVDRFKPQIEVLVARKIANLQPEVIASKDFKDTLLWVTLFGCLEAHYSYSEMPRFFAQQIKFYEAGHFPCNWIGKWPEGQFMVF